MKERETDKLFKEQATYCERICEALDNRGFSCRDCKENCCYEQIIGILRSEAVAIANHLHISKSEFRKKYTAITTHPSRNVRVRCLKPTIDSNGREVCVFLKNDKCSIYEIRPHTCRGHPFYKHSHKELVSIHGTIRCELVRGFNEILKDFIKKHNLDNKPIIINEAPAIPLDIVKEMLDLP